MPHEISEFSGVERSGKIHRKLKIRLILLAVIALVAAGMVAYDLIFKQLPGLPVIGFASFGFILGFFLFNKINKITWDEKEEVVKLGKFDAATGVILVVYIAYRVSIDLILKSQYHNALLVSGFSIATLFGGIVGRVVGMMWTINRVHRDNVEK